MIPPCAEPDRELPDLVRVDAREDEREVEASIAGLRGDARPWSVTGFEEVSPAPTATGRYWREHESSSSSAAGESLIEASQTPPGSTAQRVQRYEDSWPTKAAAASRVESKARDPAIMTTW